MRLKKFLLTFLFIALYIQAFSNGDYTMEELEELKRINAITNEDYQILKSELLEGSANTENFYTLKISGKKLSNRFKVIRENQKDYFSLSDFLNALNFKNFTIEKDFALIYLGENLEEVKLKNGEVYFKGKSLKKEFEIPKYILKDDEIYIESKVFEYLFLIDLNQDIDNSEISMELNFTPPIAINQLLDISKSNLENQDVANEIVYEGKRELFNLGYTRLEAGKTWERTEEDSHYSSDWDGSLSYQGGLLYGEFLFDYDIKENEFSNFNLNYNNIWKDHSFEISKSSFDSDGAWGFHFYKDKGFYDIGGIIVIREKVPVGSRAQLLYMGTPIAVEDEENGEVIFSNDMIRTNRDYQLKIYHPDGKIVIKDIKTSEDYNRQAQGQVEYDISANENKELGGYDRDANIYFGITDKLTFGAGITKEVIKNLDDEKDYMTDLKGELTYGDTLNGYSYTLQLNGQRTLESYYDEMGNDLSDRHQYGYLAEITKDKWRTKYEETRYAKFYKEKAESSFEVSYDVTDAFRVDYSYDQTKYRTDKFGEKSPTEKNSSLGFSYDKTFGKFLVGTSVDLDLEESKNNEYNFNVYYSGFKSLTTRLENTWTNNGEDYEMALEVYNNNLGGFLDVSAEVRYSNTQKESFGLKFSMTLDSWFKFDLDGDDHKNTKARVGIDRIIDLKNPKLEVDNMDVSRAKVITFVDKNNNNVYDKGEPRVDGVEVTIGNQTVITDRNGEARLYNLSNGIIYDVEPTIKKPSYTMGSNAIKIKSNFSSDVDVYIPIKPMMNLTGYLTLDKTLNIPKDQREEFYSDIIIQILDKKGKEIDLTSPDNTGYFDISGLFPEEYTLKAIYVGTKYKIKNLDEKVKLYYDESQKFDLEVELNVSSRKIEIVKGDILARKNENKKTVGRG